MTHSFNKNIFREYDIRGIVGCTLTVKDAYFIGHYFANNIKKKFKSCSIVVGYDGRLSSKILEKSLIEGMLKAGAYVIRIGLSTSPMLYFSAAKIKSDGGIMITGSHNPSNYNGFKILTKEGSLYGTKIKNLSNGIQIDNSNGRVNDYDIVDSYISELSKLAGYIEKNLSVVWDPGNGSTGFLIQKLIPHLPGKHYIINGKVDGTFPSHHPDPTEEKNLVELKRKVKSVKANIGIAFDGDGDRLGVVDQNGNIIAGDKLLLLFSKDILKNNPRATIIGDIKSSEIVFREIKKAGGNPIMWKTGHSLIKNKMKETNALLAGEMSGHIFFADTYYGFDDGVYAALRLLKIISKNFDINNFLNLFSNFYSTPEIKVNCDEKMKFNIIKKIIKITKNKYKNINLLDGIRVNMSYGWWLIRASNTQPAIIIRFEAKNLNYFNNIKKQIYKILSEVDLNLKFDI